MVLLGILLPVGSARKAEAADASISKSSISLYTEMSGQIKLKNANSDVTWISTNKKLVRIAESYGTYHEKVMVYTRAKTGTCKVIAKMDGHSYVCKVKVKDDGKLSRIKVEKAVKTGSSLRVSIQAVNKTKVIKKLSRYSLEKFVNGKWQNIELENLVEPQILWSVVPWGSDQFDSSKWIFRKSFYMEPKGELSDLSNGLYRLKFNNYSKKKICNYAIFTIQ
jgi:hypothetical protein